MSDVERIKAGVVLRLHAMQPNDREAVIFTLRRALQDLGADAGPGVEKVARAILDCIIQRNATIAGRKYNPEHLLGGTHADNVRDKISKNRDQFGSKHYNAKLTEEDMRTIRNSTKTYAELGREYGISRGGIHNIKSGRSWGRVK